MGEKTRLVYATFTTPDNAIGGNAVCAFKVEVVCYNNFSLSDLNKCVFIVGGGKGTSAPYYRFF